MKKVSKKFKSEDEAVAFAELSTKNKIKVVFVILSRGFYYVEEDPFIRSWEELVLTVSNGKIK